MSLIGKYSIWSGSLANIQYLNYRSILSGFEKISSGYRINKASDDPAGLVISEQLRASIASLGAEMKNSQMQIAKYETASATIAELRSQLTEIRTLAVHASNGGFNSESSQEALDISANYIKDSYNRIVVTAGYNGVSLFDGSDGSLAIISELDNIDLSSPELAGDTIARIDSAVAELDSVQIELGSTQKNELERGYASMQITQQNLIAAESGIRDVDFFKTYSKLSTDIMKMKIGLSLMNHSFVTSKGIIDLIG